MFYKFATEGYKISNVNKVYGITQNPITKNFMIITKYYEIGNLTHYITKNFFEISWGDKLERLKDIAKGLRSIHSAEIIHKDYHSGNIFFSASSVVIVDLGLSK
jgi:serine/threonine protein kinase